MDSNGFPGYHWRHTTDLPIGANLLIAPGDENSGFTAYFGANAVMPIIGMTYFAIDVFTDNTVNVLIQISHDAVTWASMATLVCGAVLRHNTIYDLPAPFNVAGYLVICGVFMRLRVNNGTGAIVSPFHLFAKVWA